MNELKVEYLPINSLKPYERNARRHEKKDVDAIAASIEYAGFNDPIGIWGDENLIVEGHGRLYAAQKLGMDTVPCIRLDHLDDEQRRAYALAHNRTAELSDWIMDIREEELASISDVDMSLFVFDPAAIPADETQEQEDDSSSSKSAVRLCKCPSCGLQFVDPDADQFGTSVTCPGCGEEFDRNSDTEEYQEFVDKFTPKKTTDDVYTPENIYNAVADWVAKEYSLNKENFVRPFYPGADYQAFDYKPESVVVDNPPFSILGEIKDFYVSRGIPFFLWAQWMTVLSGAYTEGVSAICLNISITYENGASISTSFLTNMDRAKVRSAPDLYLELEQINTQNSRKGKNELPNYVYPLSVVSGSAVALYSKHGVDFRVAPEDCAFIRSLDAQSEVGKAIFGAGFLLSNRGKAEREKAEREKAEREKAVFWELSEREKKIIEKLNEGAERGDSSPMEAPNPKRVQRGRNL